MNNDTVTVTLTIPHLDVIAKGLAELPFKVAAPVIQEVQKQLDAARVAAEAAQQQSNAGV